MKYNRTEVDGQMSLYPEAVGASSRQPMGHNRCEASRQAPVMVGGVQLAIKNYFYPELLDPKEMVEKNMVLVQYVYYEPWMRKIRISVDLKDELFAEGYLALVKAANGFAPERGVQFNTYASAAIRYTMRRKIQESRRNDTVSLYTEDAEGRYLLDTLPDTKLPDPDTALQQQELHDSLLALRERFANRKSIAIGLDALLLKQQGLNSREIGDRWGKSANYVTAVISRARHMLSSELAVIRDCA